MLTTISFVAAVLAGSVSASPYKYGGYGNGYGNEYGQSSESSTTPSVSTTSSYGDHSTSVIPSGSSIPYSYVKPVTGTGRTSYSSGLYTYNTPSGSGYTAPSGSGYASPSASGHGAYTSPSGTGYVSSSTTLVGTGTKPVGTGKPPGGTGKPPGGTGKPPGGTGTSPVGTGTSPVGTGTSPVGTGTTPVGTGSGGSGSSYTVTKPQTITITSNVPYTTTITHTSVTTYVETITTFVPHSTPVATQESSTYYSSYLSLSYITKTVTHTSTGYQVICPITTPSHAQYTGAGQGSGNNHIYSSLPTPASGHSIVTDIYNHPAGPEQTYAPHTVYGPSVESCPAAKTVYSTVVIEVTKTVEAPYSHKTPGATYEASTSTITPPFPAHHGNGTSPYQTGSGTVTIAKPSASGGHSYY